MYIAALFNQLGLFQKIGGWCKQANTADQDYIEDFLFRATSAYVSLIRMQSLETICISQYEKQKNEINPKDDRIIFWSPTLVEFLNEFSPFLSALRILQDMLLPLAARASIAAGASSTKRSLLTSPAYPIQKVDSCGFDPRICDLIKKYWNGGGAKVREYRNIDQHLTAVSKHCFLELSKSRVLVLLPDNPKEKNPSKFTYVNEINALSFFKQNFQKFSELVEEIFGILGYPPLPIGQSVQMGHIGPLEDGVKKTLALVIEDTVRYKGMEIGQTEERKVYARLLPPKG